MLGRGGGGNEWERWPLSVAKSRHRGEMSSLSSCLGEEAGGAVMMTREARPTSRSNRRQSLGVASTGVPRVRMRPEDCASSRSPFELGLSRPRASAQVALDSLPPSSSPLASLAAPICRLTLSRSCSAPRSPRPWTRRSPFLRSAVHLNDHLSLSVLSFGPGHRTIVPGPPDRRSALSPRRRA